MLATVNEYYWSFLTCGAQISNKTNTVGRSVLINFPSSKGCLIGSWSIKHVLKSDFVTLLDIPATLMLI